MNTISKLLSFKEAVSFINEVADGYFTMDIETDEKVYEPYLGELTFKSTFLKYYTDYKLSDDFDKDYIEIATMDIEKDYTFSEVCRVQYNGILKAIEKKVEEEKMIVRHERTDKWGKLADKINGKISELDFTSFDFKSVMDVLEKINNNEFQENIVKEYFNSDAYKKNQAEIIDTKNAVIRKIKKEMKDEIIKEVNQANGK